MIASIFISLTILLGTMFGGVTGFAAVSPDCKGSSFFGIPTWYKYLDVKKSSVTKQCEVEFSVTKAGGQFDGSDVLRVGLALIDILIRVAGLVALGFIIFGGFKYMTSQGSPENTKTAQSTLLNAVIGLVVAILAAAIVAFIGFSLG